MHVVSMLNDSNRSRVQCNARTHTHTHGPYVARQAGPMRPLERLPIGMNVEHARHAECCNDRQRQPVAEAEAQASVRGRATGRGGGERMQTKQPE